MNETPSPGVVKISTLKTPEAFRERCKQLGVNIPVEETILDKTTSPLAQTIQIGSFTVGNRWAVHPMEGWDATNDGRPSDLLVRRWERFGTSGAKFLWGMEAVVVRHDGRANHHQLVMRPDTIDEIRAAADKALEAHQALYGTTSDLLWGLQLTHSGRFCRPNSHDKFEARIAYRHPILDKKFNITSDAAVLTDDEVKRLVEDYIKAAELCDKAGIPFVDVKQCHGYLGHEFLSAFTRPGPYGGESLENRTRFAREIIEGMKQVAPRLIVGVRLSAFDIVPFKPNPELAKPGSMGPGMPEDFSGCLPYKYGFGVNPNNPLEYDLTEPIAYLKMLQSWGVAAVNLSCGSPYYNPHIQRPALFPPSDGYQPAEDPLINVALVLDVARQLKAAVPTLPMLSSGLTYLQEFLPQAGQALVRQGWTDIVGIGRMVLSYPRMVGDSLEKGKLETRAICRTFSDCTSAPRNGLISGCFPLDDFYRKRPELAALKQLRKK
jgi:2,4-dienoyl-CoA reductase-like NADH-dependent reductase (Old Yellow Enzyme family)